LPLFFAPPPELAPLVWTSQEEEEGGGENGEEEEEGKNEEKRKSKKQISPPVLLLSRLSIWLTDVSVRDAATTSCGRVRAIRILTSPYDGKSTGLGLLQFTRSADAERAVHTLPAALQSKQEGFASTSVVAAVLPSAIAEALDRVESTDKGGSGGVHWTRGGEIPRHLLEKIFAFANQPVPCDKTSKIPASWSTGAASTGGQEVLLKNVSDAVNNEEEGERAIEGEGRAGVKKAIKEEDLQLHSLRQGGRGGGEEEEGDIREKKRRRDEEDQDGEEEGKQPELLDSLGAARTLY
ncbi:rna recognition motif (or rnp domain) protein, partial [Cystoisospora suis]